MLCFLYFQGATLQDDTAPVEPISSEGSTDDDGDAATRPPTPLGPPTATLKRVHKRKSRQSQHAEVMEAMQKSLETTQKLHTEVQSALAAPTAQSSDPRLREREAFASWFKSVVPSIHDSLWVPFRNQINVVIDRFQAVSLEREVTIF